MVALRDSLKVKDPKLASGLKVAANSAAFGLFCQMNVKHLDPSATAAAMSDIPGSAEFPERCSGVIGIDFQIGEKKGLATRLMAAAVRLDSHKYGVDLFE